MGKIIVDFSFLAVYILPLAIMKANQKTGIFLAGLSLMSLRSTAKLSGIFGYNLLSCWYGG